MRPWGVAAIACAGVFAGAFNTIVGSGTLVTFPTLLAFGIAPVTANMSNTIGLVAGGISGTLGHGDELRGRGAQLRRLAPVSFAGAVGALLLLVLPGSASDAIVPVLIGLGVLLLAAGPRLNRRAARSCRTRRTRAGWHHLRGRFLALAGECSWRASTAASSARSRAASSWAS